MTTAARAPPLTMGASNQIDNTTNRKRFTMFNRKPTPSGVTTEQAQLPQGYDDKDSRYWIAPPLRQYWHEAEYDEYTPWDKDAHDHLLQVARNDRYAELFESQSDAEELRAAAADRSAGKLGQISTRKLDERLGKLSQQAFDEREAYASEHRDRLVSYIDHKRHIDAAARLHERAKTSAAAARRTRALYHCSWCGMTEPKHGVVEPRVLGLHGAPIQSAPRDWIVTSCWPCYMRASSQVAAQLGAQAGADGRTRDELVAAKLARP